LVDRKNIQPRKNLCHLSSKVLFQNRWKKKTKGDWLKQAQLEKPTEVVMPVF